MGWEKWPYWLKGGIISLGILLVSFYILFPIMTINILLSPFVNFIFFFDFLSILICKGVCRGWSTIIHGYTVWFSYIIIGIFLGWVYGKTKSKRWILIFVILIILTLVGSLLFFKYFNSTDYLIEDMSKGFNIKNDKVYAYEPPYFESDGYSVVEVKGADANSFEYLICDYALDKSNVYWYHPRDFILYIKFPDADPKTFQILNCLYTKDKNNVYVFGEVLKGVDVESFTILDSRGAFDARDKNYYYKSGRIEEARLY